MTNETWLKASRYFTGKKFQKIVSVTSSNPIKVNKTNSNIVLGDWAISIGFEGLKRAKEALHLNE